MAFTTAQRWQVHRLPVPGGDELGQRYAHAGAIEQLVTSGILTQAQRWQAGYRLPIPDGDIDTIGDRYALVGQIQSIETGGAVQELFEVDWIIAPTWSAFELPQHNQGSLAGQISSFGLAFDGVFVGQPVVTDPIRRLHAALASASVGGQVQTRGMAFTLETVSMSGLEQTLTTQVTVTSRSTQITMSTPGMSIHGS